MQNTGPRLRALEVVAKAELSSELSEELTKKLQYVRERHSERSKIVHGLWAIPMEEIPPQMSKDQRENCLILTGTPGYGFCGKPYIYTRRDFEAVS